MLMKSTYTDCSIPNPKLVQINEINYIMFLDWQLNSWLKVEFNIWPYFWILPLYNRLLKVIDVSHFFDELQNC